ncbi:MAG: TadE/TadG family type IV pilus assembly protein [Methylococcales bacterium]|nr:TadE/TadG family type IV pilus assembly protein [Methylococcales bacterium]MDD5630670.1 TadE/TadG family type IV pilus assembly protein [Methylococcales bacterium]
MLSFKHSIKKLETGAALVEFAIVVPLLLLLVLGVSEFSFAYYHLNTLNKSVQDGARYFSNNARCKGANDCTPIYAINVTPSSNPYYANAVNLIQTGKINACNDSTTPSLMPLCANYLPKPIVSCVDVNANIVSCSTAPLPQHIMVTATYSHNFMLPNALYNFLGISNPLSLTASTVLRVE